MRWRIGWEDERCVVTDGRWRCLDGADGLCECGCLWWDAVWDWAVGWVEIDMV